MSEEKALAKTEGGNSLVGNDFSNAGVQIRSLDEAIRFAKYVHTSGLAPKGLQTPEAILIAMQCGLEIGLKAMQGIQSIAVINGRPALWGDAVLGLCKASNQLVKFQETYVMKKTQAEDPNDGYTAVCTIRRTGDEADTVSEFSIEDAKRAGLWMNPKKDPWVKYPKRMLKYRARTFALRDKFADILMGIPVAEEVMDAPIDITNDVPEASKPKPATKSSALEEPEAVLDAGTKVTKQDEKKEVKAEAAKVAKAKAEAKAKKEEAAKKKEEAKPKEEPVEDLEPVEDEPQGEPEDNMFASGDDGELGLGDPE